jgi:dynein heavy chain 1, cytosolic
LFTFYTHWSVPGHVAYTVGFFLFAFFPKQVKLTLECVAIMLGETNSEWTNIRKLLAKTDFIPSILNFDADKLSAKQIKLVTDNYLEGNPELTSESVTKASKACGPLYKWAESQIKYSTIFNNIQPLREEVARLEVEAQVVKEEKEKLDDEVSVLEKSIAQYKTDYATLIRDVEALKAEMGAVTTKIERAESLLRSLGHESERWAKSSETFDTIMRSLVGDGLLMGAFLTYGTYLMIPRKKNKAQLVPRYLFDLMTQSPLTFVLLFLFYFMQLAFLTSRPET